MALAIAKTSTDTERQKLRVGRIIGFLLSDQGGGIGRRLYRQRQNCQSRMSKRDRANGGIIRRWERFRRKSRFCAVSHSGEREGIQFVQQGNKRLVINYSTAPTGRSSRGTRNGRQRCPNLFPVGFGVKP